MAGNSISLSSIRNKCFVGRGSFGTVYRATWKTEDKYGNEVEETVAIKSVMGGSMSQVLLEIDRMAGLNHKNVIRLLGFIDRGRNPPWIVMEYMPLGNLLSYIHQEKYRGGIRKYGMKKLAVGIASGMEYIHRKKRVHGDLAARNCLVGPDFNVKICDLGFVDGTNSEYYFNDANGLYTVSVSNSFITEQRGCPTRWMPPENLPFRLSRTGKLTPTNFKCTFEGDVWSFGVVLFEIWSRGETPFGQKENKEACRQLLQKRCTPTDFCPFTMCRLMFNLMQGRCWRFNPEERPRFAEILEYLQHSSVQN